MTVTTQKDAQYKNTFFRHEKTGRVFRLILVTNEFARASARDNWIITAVYEDSKRQVWSSPLKEFEKKFVEIDPFTGKKC